MAKQKPKPAARKKTAAPVKKPAARKKTAAPVKKPAAKPPEGQPWHLEDRRPSPNPDLPDESIDAIEQALVGIKRELDNHAALLRPLDRARLNSIGIKRLGLLQRSLEYINENEEFLPRYLTSDRLMEDARYYQRISVLSDLSKQAHEMLKNITLEAADAIFSDILKFYASVREAAKRRIDPAETINKDLETFFTRKKGEGGAPTQKKAIRDAKALIEGRRDGKIAAEHIKPKLAGGKHEIIDETFKDSASFKETESTNNEE